MQTTDMQKIKRNLTALVEFSRIVNSSLDLEFTLNNLLLSCFGKFLTSKGFIALKKHDKLEIIISKGIVKEGVKNLHLIEKEEQEPGNLAINKFLEENNLVLLERICSSRKCLGIICLGEKINKTAYTDDEIEFLKTILNIAATAIENSLFIEELKSVNRELDNRVNRLNSLFELSKEFGLLNEESRISRLLLYSLLGNFMVSSYAIISLVDDKAKILESTIPKHHLSEELKLYNLKEVTTTLYEKEIEEKFNSLRRFNFCLIVPMQLQGITKGLILLGKRMNNINYSESDIEFISSLGGIAITSLENRRLFIEELEKQKLEEELELAKDIQKNLFPLSLPKLKNIQIAATSISTKQVGGDYYDVIDVGNNNYCIAIGDVSGKGIPASLLMANLQAFLKSICKQNYKVDEATGIINDLVSENTSDGRFITFFWGYLNEKERTFHYVNAGHNPPLLIRNQEIHYLDKGGLILGVMQTLIPYSSELLNLEAGDLIVMFTDGVTEAKDINDDEYSDKTLEELLLRNTDKSAEELLSLIKNDVQTFTKGQIQSDDITIVIIKVM